MKIFLKVLLAMIKWFVLVEIEVLTGFGFYVLIGKNMPLQTFALLYFIFCIIVDIYVMKGEK